MHDCLSVSGKEKMFKVIMETIDLDLPAFLGTLFGYAANPGLIIPAVLLMVSVHSQHPPSTSRSPSIDSKVPPHTRYSGPVPWTSDYIDLGFTSCLFKQAYEMLLSHMMK